MSALRMADADLVKQGADAELSMMILQTQPPGQPQVLPGPQDHADDQLMPKGSGSMNQGADATHLHTQWTGFQNGLFYASSLGADSQSHWRYYTACLRAGFCLPAQQQDLNLNHADNQRMAMREDFMIQGKAFSLPSDLPPIQGGPLLNLEGFNAQQQCQLNSPATLLDWRGFYNGLFDGPLRTGYFIGLSIGVLWNTQDHGDNKRMRRGPDATPLHLDLREWTGFQSGLFSALCLSCADHEEYLGRPIFHVACLGADYQAFYLSPQHQGSLTENDADHQQMPMCLGFTVQGMEYSLPADLHPIQGGPLLNQAARLRFQPLTGKIVRDLREDFDSEFFDGPLRTGYSIGFHVGGLLNELFVTQRAASDG